MNSKNDMAGEKQLLENEVKFLKAQLEENKKLYDAFIVALQCKYFQLNFNKVFQNKDKQISEMEIPEMNYQKSIRILVELWKKLAVDTKHQKIEWMSIGHIRK